MQGVRRHLSNEGKVPNLHGTSSDGSEKIGRTDSEAKVGVASRRPDEHTHPHPSHTGHQADDTAVLDWRKVLAKFEKYRITRSYSLESLFHFLNPRQHAELTIREFVTNLNEYCPEISIAEAECLAAACDYGHYGVVTPEEMQSLLNQTDGIHTISSLLESHPIFPEWLAERNDFQNYFSDWESSKVLLLISLFPVVVYCVIVFFQFAE